MLARLTRLGISCDATSSQLRSAREHFEQHNYLRLPGFIEPGLLRLIQRHLRSAKFEEREYKVGRELTLPNSPVASVLYVLMNDPKLFRLIRRVTGCGPIGCFISRLYQMIARKGLAFTWHDDMAKDRKVAISINLSDARYHGGTLQIRERPRGVCEAVPNLGFGDAIIFRVAEHLEHRVTPIVGRLPKTAVSGWFCSRPRYTSLHKDLIARSESAIAARAIRKQKSLVFPSSNDVVKIASAVVSQTTRRETFVANIRTARCYGLNQTGGRIWELLAQGRGLHSISAAIAREYGARRRDVERDVLALVCKLAQRDLVKIVRATGPRRVRAVSAAVND
jgi:Coenzyme PQQ synthesis protein D (PqqD)/2OG-Fe(II) oxygenase superfamily